jgi:hypothetical protein
VPAEAGLERRLVKVLDKNLAVRSAVLAFELERTRVEDVAETESVPLLLHSYPRATNRLALGIDDMDL